jgi:hypothetical protein
MVKVKKMNESNFSRLHKRLTVDGELIRARQEEKQGLLDEFNQESKRYFFGKISQKALASSVQKTNKELMRLDKSIRELIAKIRSTSNQIMKLSSAQTPIGYKASLTGVKNPIIKKKKKKVAKKKAVKKKTVKKKVVKKVSKKKPTKKKPAKKKK